jgi:hypothetical protein
MAHAAAPPPSQPADGNPRLARTIRSYGFAATAAAATGVGGGLPREEPPRPIDYSTTLLVGCGGAHDGDGAKPDGCGSVLVVVVDLLTLGCDVHATLFTAYRGLQRPYYASDEGFHHRLTCLKILLSDAKSFLA